MKLFAYMAVSLFLPFCLLAENDAKGVTALSPEGGLAAEEIVTDPGFKRFKSILNRMPFGRPPPGFNPDAPNASDNARRGPDGAAETAAAEISATQQQIISSVRVSVLNVTPSGKIVVGFTDSSVQPERNYLLEVGEKREDCDWLVMGADPEKREVTLSKDGVEATLRLGGGSGSSDKKKEDEGGGGAVARSGLLRRQPQPMAPGGGVAAAEAGGKMSGLDIARMRRKERLEREMADKEQQRLADEQARKEREQEAEARKQEAEARKLAAEERKAQMDQLMQIQEELRRQREEKEAERRAAAEEEP